MQVHCVMEPQRERELRLCRECGAVSSASKLCWLCGADLSDAQPVSAHPCPRCGSMRESLESACASCAWHPPPIRETRPGVTLEGSIRAARTFSLESVFLSTTLFAVGLGLVLISPALAFFFAILAGPAWIRTAIIRVRKKSRGDPMSAGEKTVAFLGGMFLVFLILLAAVIALFVSCFLSLGIAHRIGTPPNAAILSFNVSFLVALIFAAGVFWLTLPREG